jgi:hypothetical protein
MPIPRLTGLEFHWFGKGQFLANDYQQGDAMNLEMATAALAAAVGREALDSFTGPESLRRVSARFLLDAETAGPAVEALSTVDRSGADRRIKALRRLAVIFERTATEVEARKRPTGGPCQPPTR